MLSLRYCFFVSIRLFDYNERKLFFNFDDIRTLSRWFTLTFRRNNCARWLKSAQRRRIVSSLKWSFVFYVSCMCAHISIVFRSQVFNGDDDGVDNHENWTSNRNYYQNYLFDRWKTSLMNAKHVSFCFRMGVRTNNKQNFHRLFFCLCSYKHET